MNLINYCVTDIHKVTCGLKINIYSIFNTIVQVLYMFKYFSRLLSEVEDVLGDRKEVTGDDLDKMKYTEQVLGHVSTMIPYHMHLS